MDQARRGNNNNNNSSSNRRSPSRLILARAKDMEGMVAMAKDQDTRSSVLKLIAVVGIAAATEHVKCYLSKT